MTSAMNFSVPMAVAYQSRRSPSRWGLVKPIFALQAEQDRNVLEGMEAVGDEKRDHDDIGAGGQRPPVLDEGRLLHQYGRQSA